MKNSRWKQMTAAAALAALCLSLAACSQASYDDGYQDGYAAAEEQVYDDGYRAGQTAAEETLKQSAYDDGYAQGYVAGVVDASQPEEELPADEEPEAVEDTPNVYEEAGFVLVTDVIPDVILEMRYYSTFNFVGERINGYQAPVAYLTREAAQALTNVSEDLKQQGYRIKIYDAYRPQTAVNHFKAWAADTADTRMQAYFYPELDKSVLFVQGYIASKSGHSRGSTVDLTIVDMETGREVDMGGGFDYFGQLSHPGYTQGLTQEQIDNRNILRNAMLANGFKGISTEWWHYTLDQEPYPGTYFDFPVALPNE